MLQKVEINRLHSNLIHKPFDIQVITLKKKNRSAAHPKCVRKNSYTTKPAKYFFYKDLLVFLRCAYMCERPLK